MSMTRRYARLMMRLAAPLLLAAGLGACSSIPNWVDPTTWIGDDTQVSNQEATASPDAGEDSSSQSPSSAQTPDLAGIPPKPAPPSTADEQKLVADSLVADRSKAQYSADALRGGTEPAAPPPAPTAATQSDAASAAPPPSPEAGGPQNASSPTSPSSGSDQSADGAAAPAVDQTAAPPAGAEPSPQPPPSSTETASTEAVGAQTSAPVASQTTAPPPSGDMQVTFAPSRAPALDASVAQFVPRPILSRYQQSAAGAGAPAPSGEGSQPASSTKHRHRKKIKTSDAAAPTEVAAENVTPMLQQASYQPDSGALAGSGRSSLVAVVDFSQGTTILGALARQRVETAAHAFAERGANGYVRVVGHSSSRSARNSLARRQQLDFDRSEARATAVARELIRDGVPADKVLVEAVGDSEPVAQNKSLESDDANRHAEIFLQS